MRLPARRARYDWQNKGKMMIKKAFLSIVIGAALVGAAPVPVMAADPKPIAKHDKWGSYVINESGGKVCYMASSPDKQEGHLKGKGRGDVYALVTNRPGEGTRNVFTYISGYTYKAHSTVSVSIDGDKPFVLFTKDDSAWAPPGDTDDKITRALRKGAKMVIKGTSSRGTQTVDTFSLKGAGPAYQDIARACSGK